MTEKNKVITVTTAAHVLKLDHPANNHFMKWVKEHGQEPSKRQARKFLQAFPQYKG